jgi:hypothetical protein
MGITVNDENHHVGLQTLELLNWSLFEKRGKLPVC